MKEFTCPWCGAESDVDPSDSPRPVDYCHREDHQVSVKNEVREAQNAVDALENEVADLRRQMRDVEGRLCDAKSHLYEVKYGLRLGCVVVRDSKEYRIEQVATWPSSSKPFLYGNPKKKDGTFARTRRTLYDWEVVP